MSTEMQQTSHLHQVQASLAFAESLINTVREPLLVLDEHLHVIRANRSFYSTFQVPPDETMGRIVYELGNGQWNIPQLRTLLERILPNNSYFEGFEVDHDFETIGRRIMLLNARRIFQDGETILLAIEDITERKTAQQKLQISEIRYRRLFEAAQDGILILDADNGRIMDVNPYLMDLLAYSREDFLGRELWQIGLLKDKQSSQEMFKRLKENRYVRYEDLPLRRKTGELREVEFVSNVYEEDGTTVIQCNVRDIALRKEAERAKFFLASLVESSDDSIVTVDLQGIITTWNQAAEYIYGYRPDEAIGQPLSILSIPEEVDRLYRNLERIKRGESVETYEVERVRKDGHHIWLSLQLSPINGGDKLIGISTISRDITDRKRTEQQLEEANERISRHAQGLERMVGERTAELQEAVQSLESFCYGMAHTLRSPLRAMQGFATALLEDSGPALDANGQDYANRIVKASSWMDELIADLLEYGRLSYVELPTQRIGLEELLQNVMARFDREIENREAKVRIDHPLPEIKTNARALEQAIANLLSNALKFSKPGEPPAIRIQVEKLTEAVRISVIDNGIGIKPEFQGRIFRIFERLNLDNPGTGIGLALTERAIQRMGGRLGVQSKVGEGSRFWIELPQKS